jgi:hypothetical protein
MVRLFLSSFLRAAHRSRTPRKVRYVPRRRLRQAQSLALSCAKVRPRAFLCVLSEEGNVQGCEARRTYCRRILQRSSGLTTTIHAPNNARGGRHITWKKQPQVYRRPEALRSVCGQRKRQGADGRADLRRVHIIPLRNSQDSMHILRPKQHVPCAIRDSRSPSYANHANRPPPSNCGNPRAVLVLKRWATYLKVWMRLP